MNKFVMRVLQVTAKHGYGCRKALDWRCDGEFAPLTFFVHCNDLFTWGSADCEDVTPENIALLDQSYTDCRKYGSDLFCARVRKMRPQGAVYSMIDKEYWPLFDACGPERPKGFGNPYAQGEKEARDAKHNTGL